MEGQALDAAFILCRPYKQFELERTYDFSIFSTTGLFHLVTSVASTLCRKSVWFSSRLGHQKDRIGSHSKTTGIPLQLLTTSHHFAPTPSFSPNSGGVNAMPWASNPNVAAILVAHFPGHESGHSIADVLFGDWWTSLYYSLGCRRLQYSNHQYQWPGRL
jgi:hypothetical protein